MTNPKDTNTVNMAIFALKARFYWNYSCCLPGAKADFIFREATPGYSNLIDTSSLNQPNAEVALDSPCIFHSFIYYPT